MKKNKILAISAVCVLLIGIVIAAVVSNNGNNTTDGKFIISNEHVDVAQYKGLTYEKFADSTSNEEVDKYIVEVMNYSLEPKKNEAGEQISYDIKDLTDDIVSKISAKDYTTIEEYKIYVKQIIDQQKKNGHLESSKNNLFNEVVKNSTLKTYEEEKLQNYIDYANEYYKEYAEYLELDFNTFCKNTMGFTTTEEYNEYIKEESLNNLKIEYIIAAIADAEKIEVTDKEIQQQIQLYMSNEQFKTEEDVLKHISKDEIIMNLKYYKVLDVIYNNATEVEPKQKEEINTQLPQAPVDSNLGQTEVIPDDSKEIETEVPTQAPTDETPTEVPEENIGGPIEESQIGTNENIETPETEPSAVNGSAISVDTTEKVTD